MKKVIGILICTALLLVLAPLSVSAAIDHYIFADGTFNLTTLAPQGLADGDTIKIFSGVTATLIGYTATTYTNVKIECDAGVNLTLQNVNIDNSANNNTCALSFTGVGNSLTIEGVNTLTSGYNKSGIAVETGTALTIDGTGTLTATGGIYGAGIGGGGRSGGDGGAGGEVTISGGTVTATGGSSLAGAGGAGIGGGGSDSTFGGAGGKVTISGGTVNTTGAIGGAGIGGGGGGNNSGGAGGEVTISGGMVKATGGPGGAGIGGGAGHSGGAGGTVKIDNGTVTVTGGEKAAGIGGGRGRGGGGGAGGEVTISGGRVEAKGGDRGAGIGGGDNDSPGKGGAGGTVTINGGRVEATGGNDAAGIGGAFHGNGATVTIKGGTIITTGGNDAAGIGGGFARAGGTVTISGGSVKATAGGVLDAENIGHGSNDAGSGTLTNEGGADVFLTTVTLDSVSTATALTSVTTDADYTYGTTDTETDGAGTLYLYLPAGTLTTAGSAGAVNYKAKNGEIETKNDGTAIGTLYIPPTVTATTPSGTDVATAGDVTVTFDQAMDSAIGEIKLNGNALAAGSWTDTQNYKAPYSGLAYGTHYALTISGFKDSTNGVEMDTDTSHSFTTRAARSGGSSTFAAMEVPLPPVLDNPFTDIAGGDWFYDDVLYVYNKGIMVGVSPQHFAPDTPLTRGMFVTLLYRISGESGSYENPFSDITAGAWYENATAWATAAGICQGIGDGLFAPEQEISREQLAVMLYNYAKYQGYDLSLGADTNILSYNDALNISEYAFAALQWACGIGLIQGDGQGNLNPTGQATRAETAAILHRFLE